MFVEDLPCTIFNILFVVYGCFGAAGEDSVGKGKQAMFMLSTFLSVALGVKKFVEWRGLKEDKRNVTSWKDSVQQKLAEARRLYNEVKGVETGTVVSRELYEAASTENVDLRKQLRAANAQLRAANAQLKTAK